ncbi:MAG: hypothetical protein K0S39_1149 [Paenibacillus sp.]|jgi:AraC-like DNA-binding protein|nr:hypothetical protein [Paenibacillus sp.]
MKIRVRSYFKKLLASFFILVLIPILLVSGIYYTYMTAQMKSAYAKQNEISLQSLSSLFDHITSEIDRVSLQFSFIPELSGSVRSSYNNIYQYRVVQDKLIEIISSNQFIGSVYVYSKMNNQVLTTSGGLYELKAFFDKDIVEAALNHQELTRWHEVRSLKEPGKTAGEEVISFTRKLPLQSQEAPGLLIFNVRKEIFVETLRRVNPDEANWTMVFDQQGRLLVSGFPSAALEDITSVIREQVQKNKAGDGVFTFSWEGDTYWGSSWTSPASQWTFVKLIPGRIFQAQLTRKKTEIIEAGIIVTLLLFICSFIVSLRLYKPLNTVMNRIAGRLPLSEQTRKRSEHEWITHAVEHMLDENGKLQDQVKVNAPIIKERIVQDVLSGYHMDANTDKNIEEWGFSFRHPYFLVLIVNYDLRQETEDRHHHSVKLFLFSLIESAFKTRYETAGTLLGDERFGFILNIRKTGGQEETPQVPRMELQTVCEEIMQAASADLDISLQFLFSQLHHSMAELSGSYAALRRFSGSRAFMHKLDFLFADDFVSNRTLEFPDRYVKQLLAAIKKCNREQAHAIIRSFLSSLASEKALPGDLLSETLIIFSGALVYELYQEGYDWYRQGGMSMPRLSAASHIQEMERQLISFADALIATISSKQETVATTFYIAKAIEYMEQHYSENLLISDIASHLHINSSYLSRIFKAQTGKSPMEYLTQHRLQKGKDLLRQHHYSLQEISSMIGYNDTHSFIRFFKKYEGITPGEYRSLVLSKG